MATTKYIVNNVTGQTINGESISPKYKVYTALLTQSGGDDPATISSGPVTAGVTYEIVVSLLSGIWDFSNVGGPVYPETYTFVATASEEPNSWSGVDDLNYNNGAPVVTVLENTIGNIWFTYLQPALYQANSNGLFILNNTFCQGTSTTSDDGTNFRVITVEQNNANTVNIYSTTPFSESSSDNLLNNTPIEIRVYN